MRGSANPIRKRIFASAAVAGALVLVGVGGIALLQPTASARAQDESAEADEDYLPEAERVPADDRDWSTSQELEPKLQASFTKVDEQFSFPSEASRSHARDLVSQIRLDGTGAYDNGIEDQYVLDIRTCEWIGYARDASEKGDTAAVSRAGKQIAQRIEFPGQRKMQPDWDAMLAEDIQPLINGDYDTASELWNFQCFDEAPQNE